MSDFAQPGLISTLQRLNDTHLAPLEAELTELARTRPIALVLPCHGADLTRPALQHVVQELTGAAWLSEVVVSLNALGETTLDQARAHFAPLPHPVRLLVNDAPLPAAPTVPPGKGRNVYAAFQLLASEANCAVLATQDCDVASFRRADLARLCYAVAHPDLGYSFAKAYYSRVTDRLYGRVSRLFLAPLLHALVRIAGHHPLLDFLLSFRYPLAGEIALTRTLAASLPLTAGWGVELAHLCEIFRRIDPREVCQVDGGTGYDHKHQPAATSLARMSGEIAAELFAQLAVEGLSTVTFGSADLVRVYRREARHALRRSAALARINGLPFDPTAEESIVEAFADQLATAR